MTYPVWCAVFAGVGLGLALVAMVQGAYVVWLVGRDVELAEMDGWRARVRDPFADWAGPSKARPVGNELFLRVPGYVYADPRWAAAAARGTPARELVGAGV